MNLPHILSSIEWEFAIWALLVIAAGTALLAILSPRRFSALNAWSSAWIDVDKLTRRLDKRVDIDHHFLRHCRLFGIAVLGAAGLLAGFLLWAP